MPHSECPLQLFRQWHAHARAAMDSDADACCLGTVSPDGMPNARFIALKQVSSDGFVFGTHLASRKADEIAIRPGATLTFWWPPVRRQVRIAGMASRLDDATADELFAGRSREARIATWASVQSAPRDEGTDLEERIAALQRRFEGKDVSRPDEWGAFVVIPDRVEFLSFAPDRLHERRVFRRRDGEWKGTRLQP